MILAGASLASAAAAYLISTARSTKGDEEKIEQLISAAREGRHLALAHLIQEERVHVDVQSIEGFTALAMAAAHGHAEVVALLLASHNADHTAKNKDGTLAIHLAAKHGHVGALIPLVDRGHFWACEADAHGWHPLHHGAAGGHLDIVSALLAEKVPFDSLTVKLQQTPLMLATAAGQIPDAAACVHLLLQSHADVNKTDASGDSPLHLACRSSSGRAVIETLCTAGARLFGQNRLGDTPFDLTALESVERLALDQVLAARQRVGEHEANAALVARDRLMSRMLRMAQEDPLALKELCERPETKKLLARFSLTNFRIDADVIAPMARSGGAASSSGFASQVGFVSQKSREGTESPSELTTGAMESQGGVISIVDGPAPGSEGFPSPSATERVTNSLRAMLGTLDEEHARGRVQVRG